ncbi:uncharacterized protein EI97DRAFT_313098 [Westerdykella ornata]|uniref:Uncharacterized protein n=1 Tax=Westerdykella ornata TaxID=318751 RepID=A0A6A6JNH5_WESOR|nr:uncharacterized protein EI97DRAFT_313098 [Westerdykella ornata]KAF2277206.1 hypothetical protein EI97DRAFT_313098 [Westerdykella ornata]
MNLRTSIIGGADAAVPSWIDRRLFSSCFCCGEEHPQPTKQEIASPGMGQATVESKKSRTRASSHPITFRRRKHHPSSLDVNLAFDAKPLNPSSIRQDQPQLNLTSPPAATHIPKRPQPP